MAFSWSCASLVQPLFGGCNGCRPPFSVDVHHSAEVRQGQITVEAQYDYARSRRYLPWTSISPRERLGQQLVHEVRVRHQAMKI